MDQGIIKLIVSQGIFAVLFVYLLFYVLKENNAKEENDQKIVNELTNTLPHIEQKLADIDKKLNS